MKILCLLLSFVACALSASAQAPSTVHGTVRDAVTGAPIPYASVGVPKLGVGTVSNAEGSFRFSVPTSRSIDSLTFNCLGYDSFRVRLQPALFGEPQTVRLVPRHYQLHEVTVTGSTAQNLLGRAVRTTTSLLLNPVTLTGYYREFAQTDDQYTKFADALVDYYIGSDQEPSHRPEIQVRVRESRAGEAPLTDRTSLARAIPSPIAVDRAMTWYNPVAGNDFLDSLNFPFYRYTLQAPVNQSDASFYVVAFAPVSHESTHLNRGTVRIDRRTLAIQAIDSELPEELRPYTAETKVLSVKAKLIARQVHREFYSLNGHCYPGFSRLYAALDVTSHQESFRCAFTSEVLITAVVEPATPFAKNERYSGSLYKNGTKYQHTYWENYNTLPATQQEAAVIAKLAH